jgi:hypothetical protein
VITVLVLYVLLEKQPGVACTQVGQGTECVDNAVCQNNGPVCTCTSDFYANGGMCAASKSYIKWQNIFRVTTSVRFIVFFYLLITWLISNYIE